jgi:putative AbiEi antitoxin of type IV toxin-antitoxin system/uncharacterized protein DUF559
VRYETVLTGKFRHARPLLADIAARQHGIVTVAQLHASGLTDSAISKRVRRGELHRVGRGVYAVGHAALSTEGRWLASVFAGGQGAGLGGLAAGKLWEASRFAVPVVDVVVPRQRRPQPGVRFHRANDLDPRDLTSHRRIPVTTMHRTLVDLADPLTPHQLANVMHEAAFRGRLVVPAIRDALGRVWGRPRLRVVERALELHAGGSAGTRSGAEDAFLALIHAFAEPLVNVGFEGFERDFRWPDSQLVVEVDGPAHGRPRDRLDDARRDQALREAGYTVLRFTDEDVYQRPREVLAALTDSPCRPPAAPPPGPRPGSASSPGGCRRGR